MAMGRRKRERQESLFLMVDDLPTSGGHPFYQKLNKLLAEVGFDEWIENRCLPHYDASPGGRPSIPPGVFFRMLFVGYFECIDSQRGIAWRCADSLSLREFLGISLSERTPDHSTLSKTRQRLPEELFSEVFDFVLKIAAERNLIDGQTVGVDSTTLEANAAMKSIVRRDSGEDWNAYIRRLMLEAGEITAEETPSDEDLRRFDKRRKDKKVSNTEWVSETDPEAEITRMKDGTTHLAYKAEHVVDLESNIILEAAVYQGTHADSQTLPQSLAEAQRHLDNIGHEQDIKEVAADKGYHSAECLEVCEKLGVRTYIPERKSPHKSKLNEKPESQRRAIINNRRRMKRSKGKHYQRLRSERVERSFAHVCDTGGSRRSWLRGLAEVTKRYVIAVAAHNLGRILNALLGSGKPKEAAATGLCPARKSTTWWPTTPTTAIKHLSNPLHVDLLHTTKILTAV